MEPLTIGQVARRSEVGVETIRFYERKGLIEPASRRASGYRQYGQDAIARLRFIRQAKNLGFTLQEIGELLSLRVDPDATCADVKERARAKLDAIEGKIRALQRMHQALATVADACPGEGEADACPILGTLEEEEVL